MPTHDFENIGDVLDFDVIKGIVETIDSATDTCTVTVGGVILTALIFYHCSPDSEIRANGSVKGGAAGFAVGDEVIVMKRDAYSNLGVEVAAVVKVMGHTDGARHCERYVIYKMAFERFDTWCVVWDTRENTHLTWGDEEAPVNYVLETSAEYIAWKDKKINRGESVATSRSIHDTVLPYQFAPTIADQITTYPYLYGHMDSNDDAYSWPRSCWYESDLVIAGQKMGFRTNGVLDIQTISDTPVVISGVTYHWLSRTRDWTFTYYDTIGEIGSQSTHDTCEGWSENAFGEGTGSTVDAWGIFPLSPLEPMPPWQHPGMDVLYGKYGHGFEDAHGGCYTRRIISEINIVQIRPYHHTGQIGGTVHGITYTDTQVWALGDKITFVNVMVDVDTAGKIDDASYDWSTKTANDDLGTIIKNSVLSICTDEGEPEETDHITVTVEIY